MSRNGNTLAFLESYSNYFNRIIKPFYLSTREYAQYQYENSKGFVSFSGLNFNTNDGVNAEHIINWTNEWTPDYMLVAGDNFDVISRWFVTEMTRLRGNQYRINLRRDVINDYKNIVLSSPCFVEKGILPYNDPLIFNSEGMSFNQIKQEEWLLKDKTQVAWIIGYVARGVTIQEIVANKNAIYDATLESFNSATGLDLDPLVPKTIGIKDGYTFTFKGEYPDGVVKNLNIIASSDLNLTRFELTPEYSPDLYENIKYRFENDESKELQDLFLYYLEGTFQDNVDAIKTSMKQYEYYTSEPSTFLSYNGKIIYDSTNDKKYKLSITPISNIRNSIVELTTTKQAGLHSTLNTFISEAIALYNADNPSISFLPNSRILMSFANTNYSVKFEEIKSGSITLDIPQDRNKLEDAPYDMFAIPYGEIAFNIEGQNFNVNGDIGLFMSQAIANAGSGTWLYDLQLLPYCPITDFSFQSGRVVVPGDDGRDFTFFKKDGTAVGVMFWAKSSNFNNAIPFNLMIEDYKVESECDMYRINSPNYNGVFEFNAAKNNGIEYFNIDCTYRPYNPYIHVNPNFGGLYGGNYGDARGLICGGDFSLPQTSDAWKQYEINNKNYQNIFDRQIKNMEVNRGYQRFDEVTGAIGNSVSASMVGSRFGVAGAIAAGATSAIAGGVDIAVQEGKYKEQKSYSIDLYNMSLGNIKALPYSLAKNGALTANNKLFPFVEFFSCTDAEKEALRNKIKYNGMTVGAIRTLDEFQGLPNEPQFVQGQIIRLENFPEDTHLLNAIYEEIKKGVFL